MENKVIQFLTLGGVVGPIIFIVAIMYSAGLRPEYKHMHDFITELGATGTSNAEIMNYAGFVPTGILIFIFGMAIFAHINRTTISRIGAGLIILFGLGIFLSGLYSCDHGCPDIGSKESNIHQMIAPIAFMAAIVGILFLGISFRRQPKWIRLWVYSVVSGVVVLTFMLALINSLEARVFVGLWQRLLLITLFLWTSVTGIYIYKLDSSKTSR